ncbi:MAG: D-aminoacyl-tRNA deacylase [Thermoplasmata archaeon]|nr:D-aminoacyl-tRNA deacylase [Thermoplasmata archaeon]
MPAPPVLIVLSDPDPVARAVGLELGVGSSTGDFVEGAPIRALGPGIASLRRPGLHIHDETLDARLPVAWRSSRTTLVFPSIHRSERGDAALTVHPLGNPGSVVEVGGRPETLVPAAPRLMTDALRRLSEGAARVGAPATFEATHHGPSLSLPTFFIEIGGGEADDPPPAATHLIASVVRELSEDPRDHVVVGVGGGHYAPHFTDLALRRSIAFGHILPRHVLDTLAPAVARQARELTEGSEGVVYARAADMERAVAQEWGGRFREAAASRREGPATPGSSSDGVPGAGT